MFLEICLNFDLIILTSTNMAADSRSSPQKELEKIAVIKI